MSVLRFALHRTACVADPLPGLISTPVTTEWPDPRTICQWLRTLAGYQVGSALGSRIARGLCPSMPA
ncbi:hypothetical protein C8R44DRAFT_758068 [Mycena epipterygia]|nr:hypothetical protein C8R44DRAFT_758068 [Mycena epipterygia]